MFRFERGLRPRNRVLGEASEGAAAAPSDETKQMGPLKMPASAALEGEETALHLARLTLGEGGQPETRTLVRGRDARERLSATGRLELRPHPELPRRLCRLGGEPAPGESAEGALVEAGRAPSRPPRVTRPAEAPDQPPEGAGGGHAGGDEEPELAPPLDGPCEGQPRVPGLPVNRRGEEPLVLEAPVDDVAVPPHARRVEVEGGGRRP